MGLHPESFTSFCEALAKNSTVQHVDLRSNHLGAETAAALAQVLSRNCGLTSLGECKFWNYFFLVLIVLQYYERRYTGTGKILDGSVLVMHHYIHLCH